MEIDTIHKGDIGTRIELDAGSDISLATVLKIRYEKYGGVKGEWDAELSGTQIAYYITEAGDLDVVGPWELQLYVEMPSWKGCGEKARFLVRDIIVVTP